MQSARFRTPSMKYMPAGCVTTLQDARSVFGEGAHFGNCKISQRKASILENPFETN